MTARSGPAPRSVRRIALIAAIALGWLGGAGCSDPNRPEPRPYVPDKPARVAPAPAPRPARHLAHEHSHGAHPHPASDHHHHPHPHPHLAGLNGHHHPY